MACIMSTFMHCHHGKMGHLAMTQYWSVPTKKLMECEAWMLAMSASFFCLLMMMSNTHVCLLTGMATSLILLMRIQECGLLSLFQTTLPLSTSILSSIAPTSSLCLARTMLIAHLDWHSVIHWMLFSSTMQTNMPTITCTRLFFDFLDLLYLTWCLFRLLFFSWHGLMLILTILFFLGLLLSIAW